MSNSTERKTGHWQDLAEGAAPPVGVRSDDGELTMPSELKVRLSHGVWFGTAMGIGFAIGFLISFMALVGFVAFVIYSRFPGLFS